MWEKESCEQSEVQTCSLAGSSDQMLGAMADIACQMLGHKGTQCDAIEARCSVCRSASHKQQKAERQVILQDAVGIAAYTNTAIADRSYNAAVRTTS